MTLNIFSGPWIILRWCNQTLQVFWNVTSCRVVSSNLKFLTLKSCVLASIQSSDRSYKLLVTKSITSSHTLTPFDLELENSTVLLKVGKRLPIGRTCHPRRLESSAKPQWETSNFKCDKMGQSVLNIFLWGKPIVNGTWSGWNELVGSCKS